MSSGAEMEAQLATLSESIARAQGLLVYDVVYRRSGPRWKLSVFIDRDPQGVTIDDCEAFSRQLARELDVLDPIGHSYDLEVSSPGIERALRRSWHWERARGRSVQVKWRDAEGRTQHAVGELVAVDGDGATVTVPGVGPQPIRFENVISARIHADWK
ncbi:MAG: ribosome maturation factor RimP [Acidobacteria bacterium]|jgi:ribosome maturation factor RimP|nr:ribosome maturation factor RimP [Acidobacteriota bacterium]